MSLKLLEIIIFTPSQSFDHSCYHTTPQSNSRHLPFPILAAYLLHIAPELPDILRHGGGDSAQLSLLLPPGPFLFLPLFFMVPDHHSHYLWKWRTSIKTLHGQTPALSPNLKQRKIIKAKKPGKSACLLGLDISKYPILFCLVSFQSTHPSKTKRANMKKKWKVDPVGRRTLRATPRFQRRSWAKSADSHCISSHR